MKAHFTILLTSLAFLAICQTFEVENHGFNQPDIRIERNYSGDIDVYQGNRKVQSIEKNISGGYDVFSFDSYGNQERAWSVERGNGDEYVVYSYKSGYKQKSSTIKGYDTYLRVLYEGQSISTVRVYEGERGGFIEGQSQIEFAPLPADIPKVDMSTAYELQRIKDKMALHEKYGDQIIAIGTLLNSSASMSKAERDRKISEMKSLHQKWEALEKEIDAYFNRND